MVSVSRGQSCPWEEQEEKETTHTLGGQGAPQSLGIGRRGGAHLPAGCTGAKSAESGPGVRVVSTKRCCRDTPARCPGAAGSTGTLRAGPIAGSSP